MLFAWMLSLIIHTEK